MSNASSNRPATGTDGQTGRLAWHPLLAVVFVILVYLLVQIIGGLLVSLYPALRHWTPAQANDWLQHAIDAQFWYTVLAEGLSVLALGWFLRLYRTGWRAIGVRRPRWGDLGWGVLSWIGYFVAFIIIERLVVALIPAFNANQSQQIGFTGAHGFGLILTFISLVVLPPLVEELLMRGFLYTSLRKRLAVIPAGLITSGLFAVAHLQFGSGAPLLWIAFIDTFTLSVFLIALREKTGSIWAGVVLHATKNLFAFLSLFVFHLM